MDLYTNRGFTLIEVMMAIVIGLILISSVTATYVVQTRAYTTQDSVSEINNQSKVAHDLMANSIKMAGFGTSSDMNSDPVNSRTTVITPYDNTNAPDAITIVGGYRKAGTLWPNGVGPGSNCSTTQYAKLGSNAFTLELSGTDAPNTTDNSSLTLNGIEYVKVQSAGSGGTSIVLEDSISKSYPVHDTNGDNLCDSGRPVYFVEDVTYCVDSNMTLHRIYKNANPTACTGTTNSIDEIIAENIEDLQFAFALDADGDDILDDPDSDGEINFYDGNLVADFSTIKAVRINVLGRGNRPDVNYASLGKAPAAIENRNHSTVSDDFRRRWWKTTVKIRNP